MRFKIGTLDVPDTDEALRGLTPHGVCPELRHAEAHEAEALRQVEDARRRLADDIQAAEAIGAQTRTGQRTAADLKRALDRRQASALLVPQYEAQLTQARADLQRARETAKTKLKAEAVARTEALKAIVAQLIPICDQLRASESAIERASPGCPSLDWPQWF